MLKQYLLVYQTGLRDSQRNCSLPSSGSVKGIDDIHTQNNRFTKQIFARSQETHKTKSICEL